MKQSKPTLGTLLTDGLLLFLALTATAFGVVTAYHIQVEGASLWAGSAILTVAMLGLVNLPRYRLPTIGGVLALWGWGLWRLWEPLVWGGARIRCDVTNTVAAKLPNMATIAPVAELPEELWPQMATLWLLIVGAVYALVLALLLCRLRRSLPVVLWTLLPILPALCVTEAPDSLPMLGLLAVWFTLLLTSTTAHRDPKGTARLRLVALLCVLAVLQTLTGRLPTQGAAQPLWAADLREAAINEASRGDFSALLTRWSGWVGAGSTEYMNLLGDSPAQTGRVALRVEGKPGKYYLRGYSADVYTGRRWEPVDRAAREELETIRETGVEPLLLLGEKASVIREYYSSGYSEHREQRAVLTVENVAAPGGCIYYPYGLAGLPENARFGGDSHLERTGAVWEHTFSYYPNWERVSSYATYSIIDWYDSNGRPQGRVRGAETGEESYREFVYEHELQVPEELRPMLEDWLRETTGEIMEDYDGFSFASLEDYVRYAKGYMYWRDQVQQRLYDGYREALQGAYWNEDLYQAMVEDVWNEAPTREDFEQVEVTQEDLDLYRNWYRNIMTTAIVGHLAQTTHYDRNTSAPPAGRDYVDWFLNESRQGYCMHYATAATLLLRTAGIPARYVSGYVTDIPFSGKAEVTDHAAHAWVEIYLDGVGWYPLEVTPGFQSNAMGDIPTLDAGEDLNAASPSATAAPTHTPRASQNVEDEEDEEDEEPTPSAAPTPSQAPGGPVGPGAAGEGGTISPGVWYGVGALLLAASAVWGRWYLLRRRRRRLQGEDANAAVRYAYACRQRLKHWGGQESGELTALAEKARFSQHTLTETERDRGAELFREEARRVYGTLPWWKKPLFLFLWGKG